MSEGAGDASGRATGVEPGALSALLQEVAAAPEVQEAETTPLAPGTVLGRFEILRELGRGGFGVVYEARDRDLGRQVAVKVVRPGRIREEAGTVSREAEAIARLTHPNLVTLHDVGRSAAGPYLVFELLRGKTLDLRIEEGALPVREAVHVATEVARGLAHAHAEGVVHRDLKPANVFVTSGGLVKILDFGMAHAFGRRRVSGGTPAYMAPEQWEGDPEDERTDVFALGVMLYRMLTGEYPFPEGQGRWAAEPAIVRKLEVPGAPELADLVERMLDRAPKGRPRDGAAVLAALAPIEERLRAKPADGNPPEHARRRKATFGDLLAELRRRHVFRVMVAYGVFAFAVLQVTEPIMHGAHLPDWVLTVVLALLGLGFPVAVVLAWLYDLTAQGVRRTPSSSRPGAPSFGRGRLLVPLAVAAAVLAVVLAGAGAWYAWKRSAGRPPVAASGDAPSIAVLPFTDLSREHDQEYFADGIAEEILSTLSKVRGLRVPGRVSSFYFKGKNVEPAEIARKLHVTHLLEGSVRISGNKLRIRAEVVRASDGASVWNQTFDQDLTDVLSVQAEIARAAVRELAPALLAEFPPPNDARVDPEAYRHFLRGMSLFTQAAIRPSLEALERSVALDRDFAPAQAYLAAAASFAQTGPPNDEFRRLGRIGREAAERAVALDPSEPSGYVSRGWYRMRQDWDWTGAQADLDRALSLAPTNEWALNTRGVLASTLGRTREAVEFQRRAVALDPLNVVTTSNLAVALTGDGQLGEARKWAQRLAEISPGNRGAAGVLAWVALLEGKAEEALSGFEQLPEPGRSVGVVAALHALGREEEARAALAALERTSPTATIQIAGARAWRGDADGAFEALDRAVEERNPFLTTIHGLPLRPIRGDPRWPALLARMGLPPDGSGPGGAVLAAASPPQASLAVLPLADMSPKHDQEYFADGVAEEIRSALAHVQGLKVIGRTSSLAFKGKTDDVQAIGQKLGVANVLEGSLRKDGDAIRVTARLIRVSDGAHLWSEKYDGKLASVFEVQEGIAKAVAEALKVKLLPGKGTGPISNRAVNVEAYRLHLLARSILGPETPDARRRAIEVWERAARVDPGYALPHVFLAISFSNLARDAADPAEARRLEERARAELERALQIDPAEGSAHGLRAWQRMNRWDWDGARLDLDQAEALNADQAVVQNSRARLLAIFGRLDEAVAVQRRTLELEPLAAVFRANLATYLIWAGRLDEAQAVVRRTQEISPTLDQAVEQQATIDLLAGRAEAALRGFERSGSLPAVHLRNLAVANHALGREQESLAALATLERDHPEERFLIAGAHAFRGDRDGAMRRLEEAFARRDADLVTIKASWALRSLRGDPRYAALLRKMNLPVD